MDTPKSASRASSLLLSAVKRGHQSFVHQRRVRVLAETLAGQIPHGARVLDIGCGDGTIASLIAQLRPDISIEGVEVMVRPGCKIECHPFDGSKLPFPDNAVDVCMLVDVLHHTSDVSVLLREAARVSRKICVVKGSSKRKRARSWHAALYGLGGEPSARRNAYLQLSGPCAVERAFRCLWLNRDKFHQRCSIVPRAVQRCARTPSALCRAAAKAATALKLGGR